MTIIRKTKILNLLVIISSLIGYLEWGKEQKLFLYQAEAEIITKIFIDPRLVLHPFIILPFVGQILLLITLFQTNPSKILTIISISSLGLLLSFMFVIGILSENLKILLSTIPFLVISIYTLIHIRKKQYGI